MLTKKFKALIFIVVLAVVGLAVASFITIKSIEDAKSQNDVAELKIEELNNLLNSLENAMNDTNKEITDQKERIEKYQEIFNAWSKATPLVKDAMDIIMTSYGVVTENAHLFSKEQFDKLEDEMLTAVYTTLRSTDPMPIAKEFESKVEKANESRYDNVLKDKIKEIEQGGVTFPEDVKATEDLRKYYDSFLENKAVIESFVKAGLDKAVKNIEALLDADEEKDLAAAFEKAVAAIKTPITLNTSLKDANAAWDKLTAALEQDDKLTDGTAKARTTLDTYTARINQLAAAKAAADVINAKIKAVKISPDLATKSLIDSLEKEIAEWTKKYEIDKANTSLVTDLAPTKKAYENAIAELRTLYDAFKKAVDGIGKVKLSSKTAIENAFKTYDSIKSFCDVNEVLALKSPNTVGELYATLEKAKARYNLLVSLANEIRAEIDRLHNADPDVSRDEIKVLDEKVEEFIGLGESVSSLNTDKKDYASLLRDVRLLPDKNEAFARVKAAYDTCYAKANSDRALIIKLVAIKDGALNKIEKATSVEEILALVNAANKSFEDCFS